MIQRLRIDGWATALRALVGWPALMLGLYFMAAFLGSNIAANGNWRAPEEGVELFVETNGVHVSLIIPMRAVGQDMSDLITRENLEDPFLYGTHVMIGWGHEGIYRNAQTWADIHPADVWHAATGSDRTLLHIYHLKNPAANSIRRRFLVRENQYHQIIKDIRAQFGLNAQGKTIHYPAYGENNLFYVAHGRYSALNTCNEWVGSILRRAGVKVGLWTPLAGGVMHWFPKGNLVQE